MSVRLAAAALFTAALAFGQLPRPGGTEPPANTSGISPRSSPADYPVHQAAPGITVAATVLTAKEIKKIFPMNLDSAGYVVVEIGVFPEQGTQVKVDTDQFRLQIGDDRTMRRAVEPAEIMADRQGGKHHAPPQLPGNLPVSTTATIGYESGGPYNRGGVYTGASTTVGTGGPVGQPYPPPPPQAGKDPDDIEHDMVDKELATGMTTVPVAGYLYFAKPRQKQKNPSYDLTYRGAGAVVHMALPSPKY